MTITHLFSKYSTVCIGTPSTLINRWLFGNHTTKTWFLGSWLIWCTLHTENNWTIKCMEISPENIIVHPYMYLKMFMIHWWHYGPIAMPQYTGTLWLGAAQAGPAFKTVRRRQIAFVKIFQVICQEWSKCMLPNLLMNIDNCYSHE